jgi:hypothetical protein
MDEPALKVPEMRASRTALGFPLKSRVARLVPAPAPPDVRGAAYSDGMRGTQTGAARLRSGLTTLRTEGNQWLPSVTSLHSFRVA